MTGPQLAKAVLEGEDPKEFLRRMSAQVTDVDFQKFFQSYLDTMLWSSHLPPYGQCPACEREDRVLDRLDKTHDDLVCSDCSEDCPNNEPMADENYNTDDLSDEFRHQCMDECRAFLRNNAKDIANNGEDIRGYDPFDAAGHDFWLTRCGHGAGFWDGDWPEEAGDRLTQAAKGCGAVHLWVDDQGKIHG